MLRGDVVEWKRHEMIVNHAIVERDGQAVECVDVNRSFAQISAYHQVNGLLVHLATEESLEQNCTLAHVVSRCVPSYYHIFWAQTQVDC